MLSEDKMKCERMKLHMIYICVIAVACAILTIILSFCDNTMFKNCISVSSTVTSIILSVIAIILSVTGERTTHEIRNKVGDSVEKLEKCTNKSSELAVELTETMQQLNELYKNMNERIIDQFPNFKDISASLLQQSEDNIDYKNEYIENISNNILNFLNALPIQTKFYMKKAMMFILPNVKEKGKSFTPGDITQHLLNEGAEMQLSYLVTGMVIGYFTSGIFNQNSLEKLIEKIVIEKQD